AALHAGMVAGDGEGGAQMPFAWTDVVLHAVGASAVRVRLAPDGHLDLADPAGAPVATIGSLATRPVSTVTAGRDPLFHVQWTPVGSPVSSGPAELFEVPAGDVHEVTAAALARLQQDTTRLAIVTRGAVAARPGEDVPDLAAAAVWGLVRSAQTEQPGRYVLIDAAADTPPELLER
ncbi:hypothetical protein, partial [Amycolatopsis sp. SID8362]|uniref:SpnB-like Rossmann fold domain-containing protein n=1 Tax=Amycolatopsis sp. SID8362 TaxID=2690346 RepID=UPI00142B77A1